MPGLSNLSDTQSREVMALFDMLDTDRDGRIDYATASHLCERLGFHAELPRQPKDASSSSTVSKQDFLAWMDEFSAQTKAETARGTDLRISQRYALLHSFDHFGGGAERRVTRKALMGFMTEEQHKVRPDMFDALLEEFGDGFTLTTPQLKELLRQQQQSATGR